MQHAAPLSPNRISSTADTIGTSSSPDDVDVPPVWTLSRLILADAPFPCKLYEMLKFAERKELTSVVSWLSHGMSFKVNDNDKFMSEVAPHFFKATKLRSIHRQLNLWGFKRVPTGEDRDSWFHTHFLRGQPEEMKKIVRTKIKGKQLEEAKRILPVPNFYQMPPQAAATPLDTTSAYVSDLEAENMLFDNDAAVMLSSPLLNRLLKPRRISISCSSPLYSAMSSCSTPKGPLVRRATSSCSTPKGPLVRRDRYSCPDISTSSTCVSSFDNHSKASSIQSRMINHPMPFGANGQEIDHDGCNDTSMNDDEFSLFIDKMIQDPF